MTDFLLKSTITMTALLGLYYLLFEREKMHRFNRFYLLSALVFSFAVPFITIEIYHEVTAISAPAIVQTPMKVSTQIVMEAQTVQETIDFTPYLFLAIYVAITLLFAMRFVRNVVTLKKQIINNQTIAYKQAILVLVDDKIQPYTFLKYIFINKQDYEERLIEEELFAHELAHVNQKHTLDVLFIEALKTVFWFNPLIYFYKKAIQLNHEFLADETVVSHQQNIINYQQVLLKRAFPISKLQLTSSLNFSLTKKRFIMMTKATSKTRAFILKTIPLPVICGILYLVCTESIAKVNNNVFKQQPTVTSTKSVNNETDEDKKRDTYYAGVRVVITDKAANLKIDKPYEELTLEQKRKYMFLLPAAKVKKSPTTKELESYKDKSKYAIWIDGKNVDNKALSKYSATDIAFVSGSSVYKNARTKQHPQPFQYNLYTHAYFDSHLKNLHLKYTGDTCNITFSDSKKEAITPTYSAFFDKKINNIAQITSGPEFPGGGLTAFRKFFSENYNLPKQGKLQTIIISFRVETDGSLTGIRIKDGKGTKLETEAIATMKKSPKWIPGKQENKPESSKVEILFTIDPMTGLLDRPDSSILQAQNIERN